MRARITLCIYFFFVGIGVADDPPKKSKVPASIKSLFTELEAGIPKGWKISYVGDEPEFKDARASLRYAIAISRKEPVSLRVNTLSSPRGPENMTADVKFIIYPDHRSFKGGFGWHSLFYSGNHFRLKEPYAGIGSYSVAPEVPQREKIQKEISRVKELILEKATVSSR